MESTRHRRARIWLFGLVAVPLAGTLVVCPVFGLKLQNHWGYQCLQFVSLWLAWRLRALPRPGLVSLALCATAIHATLMIFAFLPRDPADEGDRRVDIRYPARSLAAAVHRDWRGATPCPLRLVIGPSFEAGLVSVYTAGWPAVLEDGDFAHTPWVRPDDIGRHGAVWLAHDAADLDDLPATARGSMELQPRPTGLGRRVFWAVLPPVHCSPGPHAGARSRRGRPRHHHAPLPALRGPVAMNILIVDDNQDSADSLADLLKLKRHHVRVAYGGEQATAAAADELPEVVICDINMPGVDGLETARRLRALPGGPSLRLIALTGWTGPDTSAIAAAGYDLFLPKPVDCPRLFEALATGR